MKILARVGFMRKEGATSWLTTAVFVETDVKGEGEN